MNVCQKCGANRVVEVCSKATDLHFVTYKEYKIDGYMPYNLGIGGDDYVEIDYCLECGQLQGTWPIEEDIVIESLEEAKKIYET